VTTFERKSGKHERIKTMLKNICEAQPKPSLEDELAMGVVVGLEDENQTTPSLLSLEETK